MHAEIRNADARDLPEIITLMREFAEFEKLEDSFFVTEENLFAAFFGDKAFAKCLVAVVEKETVAFAIGFPVLKTFRGERSFYLEDLYVKNEFRVRGLGYEMLKAVAALAKAESCVRMDWQALDWNEKAIRFYQKIGAEINHENVDFRLIEEQFELLVAEK